jgi:hypothetical protein
MKRLPSIILSGAVVAALAACAGSTGGLGAVPTPAPTASADPTGPDLTPATSGSPASATPSFGEPGSGETPGPSSSPAGTTIIRAYFILGGQPGSAGLVPVLREVPRTTQVATAAMDALLSGPTADETAERTITSAVPAGTRLLAISIKNGLATVDLSTEFDSGGASGSMHDRLAQVVYTLTQFSTVKSVVFQIEGQTVTVFGSEGITLDGPVGRADYKDQLPAIFVDRPAYGAALGNPGRVSGNADVFEATFRVTVLDASGKSLVDQQVMATCGTGCRGTFDAMPSYTVAKGQYGTLRVYNPSAKDGTPEDIRDYRVWLTPAG